MSKSGLTESDKELVLALGLGIATSMKLSIALADMITARMEAERHYREASESLDHHVDVASADQEKARLEEDYKVRITEFEESVKLMLERGQIGLKALEMSLEVVRKKWGTP